jgi:precorrin-6B methylase 2
MSIEYKSELKKIVLQVELDKLEDQLNTLFKFINEKDLAGFFIDSIYLKNVLSLLIDEHWMQSKKASTDTEIQFDRFIKPFLNVELKPLLFLQSFFTDTSIGGLHLALKAITQTEAALLRNIKSKPYDFQKKFLQIALLQMSELYELEHRLNSDRKKTDVTVRLSLYRAFDVLDQIFDLDYIVNEVQEINQKERLYEGAGVGVQSSYATTVLALRYLNLAKGSRFIDLGSGYGRIGLVVGLMRPDIQFTGYEFVKERVDIANKASEHFGINQHVQFMEQDLSNADFKIPLADTFYIFDAFTDASYAVIMDQLQEMSLNRKITVVTKGNAKLWMKNQYWLEPQEFNEGNLCLFRSRARPRI